MKRIYIPLFVLASSTFALWVNEKPDPVASQLNSKYALESDVGLVVGLLEELDFEYTIYEFDGFKFKRTLGTGALSPLTSLTELSPKDFAYCQDTNCVAIRATKWDWRAVVNHHYRYFWVFAEGKLTFRHQRNSYWNLLNI